MIKSFLPTVARLINSYLKLDPTIDKQLTDMNDKVIAIHLTDRELKIFLLIKDNTIDLTSDHEGKTDAEIVGRTLVLWQMLRTTKVHDEEVTLSGDIELIQTIKKIFSQLDIDWEEQVSKFTGDIIAHQMMSHARSIKNWFTRTNQNVQTTLTEYLQEERRILVTKLEIEDFFQDIAKLRNDVDRAEAKITRVLKQYKIQEFNT